KGRGQDANGTIGKRQHGGVPAAPPSSASARHLLPNGENNGPAYALIPLPTGENVKRVWHETGEGGSTLKIPRTDTSSMTAAYCSADSISSIQAAELAIISSSGMVSVFAGCFSP